MPLYTFENKRTGKTFTEMMSISEMESYLKKNKHIKQIKTEQVVKKHRARQRAKNK